MGVKGEGEGAMIPAPPQHLLKLLIVRPEILKITSKFLKYVRFER